MAATPFKNGTGDYSGGSAGANWLFSAEAIGDNACLFDVLPDPTTIAKILARLKLKTLAPLADGEICDILQIRAADGMTIYARIALHALTLSGVRGFGLKAITNNSAGEAQNTTVRPALSSYDGTPPLFIPLDAWFWSMIRASDSASDAWYCAGDDYTFAPYSSSASAAFGCFKYYNGTALGWSLDSCYILAGIIDAKMNIPLAIEMDCTGLLTENSGLVSSKDYTPADLRPLLYPSLPASILTQAPLARNDYGFAGTATKGWNMMVSSTGVPTLAISRHRGIYGKQKFLRATAGQLNGLYLKTQINTTNLCRIAMPLFPATWNFPWAEDAYSLAGNHGHKNVEEPSAALQVGTVILASSKGWCHWHMIALADGSVAFRHAWRCGFTTAGGEIAPAKNAASVSGNTITFDDNAGFIRDNYLKKTRIYPNKTDYPSVFFIVESNDYAAKTVTAEAGSAWYTDAGGIVRPYENSPAFTMEDFAQAGKPTAVFLPVRYSEPVIIPRNKISFIQCLYSRNPADDSGSIQIFVGESATPATTLTLAPGQFQAGVQQFEMGNAGCSTAQNNTAGDFYYESGPMWISDGTAIAVPNEYKAPAPAYSSDYNPLRKIFIGEAVAFLDATAVVYAPSSFSIFKRKVGEEFSASPDASNGSGAFSLEFDSPGEYEIKWLVENDVGSAYIVGEQSIEVLSGERFSPEIPGIFPFSDIF